ncbi:hypothetical protein YPPY04_3639, partial [Yersinia pestis PY-04]
MAAATRGEI